MRGRLGYREDDVSGADFRTDGRSCVVDGKACLAVSTTLLKLVAWHDNEWGAALRLVELLLHMMAADQGGVLE